MIKYLVLYFYNSEIDVLAVCDTFEQAKAEMIDDYESFFESIEGEGYSDVKKYLTCNDAEITSSGMSCHWNIRKITI